MLRQIFDDMVYLGRTVFRNLPDVNSTILSQGLTTPDVSNLELVIFANVAPVTITNFTGGSANRTIRIKGDGMTSIANNSTIKTSTGADKLLSADGIYSLTLINEVWYEQR